MDMCSVIPAFLQTSFNFGHPTLARPSPLKIANWGRLLMCIESIQIGQFLWNVDVIFVLCGKWILKSSFVLWYDIKLACLLTYLLSYLRNYLLTYLLIYLWSDFTTSEWMFVQHHDYTVAIKCITKKNLAKSQNLLSKEIKILQVELSNLLFCCLFILLCCWHCLWFHSQRHVLQVVWRQSNEPFIVF